MSARIDEVNGLSHEELCACLEQNFINFYRRRQGVNGSVFYQDAAIAETESPTGLCYLNRVFCAKANSEELLKAKVDMVTEKFHKRQCPMLWHVGALTPQAQFLRQYLQEHGAKQQTSNFGMVLRLPLSETRPCADELKIEMLNSEGNIDDWLFPFQTCFNVFGAGLEQYQATMKTLLGKSCADVWFTGYVEGKPVCTAAYSIDSEVIVLYSITTLPEFRKRGYAQMMTEAAINHARRKSNLPVALYSTTMAIPFYRELGFTDLYELETYLIEADGSL